MAAVVSVNVPGPITVRPMVAADVAEAGAIVRIAFGTFLGIPNPESLWPDRDAIGTRRRANPDGAVVAEIDGTLAGSNIATRWGSFAYFGPLTIRPALWDRGIAQHLIAATLEIFERWEVSDSGLFTFANSPKHIHLYEKFGFAPRFLTALLAKPVGLRPNVAYRSFSGLSESQKVDAVRACRALTDSLYPGLDVSCDIESVDTQMLGDTVILWDADVLDAFAICHCGEGSEAGSNVCYMKFAAARSSGNAETIFGRLLDACERFAVDRGLVKLETGVNLGRSSAYRALLGQAYSVTTFGVAMHRYDRAAYNRTDILILDDWR